MTILPFFTTHAEVDEKALEILEKTSAYYQGLENFCAAYTLTISYPEEDRVQLYKITITTRGQQYRLCYDQNETITDGETVWVYDKALKEVTISEYAKTDLSVNFAELPNLYQQGYDCLYVKEVVRKKNKILDVVRLIPSDADNTLKSITLEIDRATSRIDQWEIVQSEETKYTCKVHRFVVNIPLSDEFFTFDLSAHGALEVIDLRENELESDFSDDVM